MVDEAFRDSRDQSIQHTLVLEGTCTRQVSQQLSRSHIFTDQNSEVSLEYIPLLFFPSCQASKWFRANSQNVSYVVSVQKQSGKRAQVCSTRRNYCTFQLRTKTAKLYLNAVNAAGKSNPTKVHILFCKGTALILRNYLKMMARVIVFF